MMPEPAVDADRVARLSGALTPAACAALQAQIAAADAACAADHPDRQPTSSSLRLRALGTDAFDAALHLLWQGPAAAWVRQRLGAPVLCLAGQCWVRRQYPPALRPPGAYPHAWHQDGALGCRFDGADEGLAPIVTVWVPLQACGDDAPSLEWIDRPADQPISQLLPPDQLTDAAVAARHGPQARRQARLQAGEALAFDGALLHRTHVGPAMRLARTSVEWRFAAPGRLPTRLAAEPVRLLRD